MGSTAGAVVGDWRDYEEYIVEKLEEWGGDEAEVLFDQELPGTISGVKRQVDALVTGAFAGGVEKGLTAAVDCKCYSRKVDIKAVEAFLGLVEDVQTDLGLLVTNVGYSEAAIRRANRRGIRIHTVPVYVGELEALPRPYFPSHDEAYYEGDYFDHAPYGDVGAFVTYRYVDNGGYSDNPEVELDWMDDPILSGTDDEVSWGDGENRRRVASAVLEHRLQRKPERDEVTTFVREIARSWEDGIPWAVYEGELARVGL